MRQDFPMDHRFDENLLVGVDEAGRGALVGPVFAAAVVLGPRMIVGLDDSKRLTPAKRHKLALEIQANSLYWAIASSSAAEIDDLNILQASFLAMLRAVQQILAQGADPSITVVVDGHICPPLTPIPPKQVFCLVKGDQRLPAISAASILAKVARDQYMQMLHEQYPAYGLDRHKGYPTAAHLSKLAVLGAMSEYRTTFKPVQSVIAAIDNQTVQQQGLLDLDV